MFGHASIFLSTDDAAPEASILTTGTPGRYSLAIQSRPLLSAHTFTLCGTHEQITSIIAQLQASLAALPAPEAAEVLA